MNSIHREIASTGFAVREILQDDIEGYSVSHEMVQYRISRQIPIEDIHADVRDTFEIHHSEGILVLSSVHQIPDCGDMILRDHDEGYDIHTLVYEKEMMLYIIQGQQDPKIHSTSHTSITISVDEDTSSMDDILGEGEALSTDESDILSDIIHTVDDNGGYAIVERARISPLVMQILSRRYSIDEDISYVSYIRRISYEPRAYIRESLSVSSSDDRICIDIDEFAIGILICKDDVEGIDINTHDSLEMIYSKYVDTYIISEY